LQCTGDWSNRNSKRYRFILCGNSDINENDINNHQLNKSLGSRDDRPEGHRMTVRGSRHDHLEGHGMTPQKKDKETKQNIYLNKEDEYKKNIANEISIKEYVVNNNVESVKPQGITNQINEWFITLWKEYYKMPYKADLFETERLAHELNHDWESFLIIVKSYQSDPYWAKISMSPKMIRKAWDKLGSRAKVSEEQMREVRKMEIDTYEKKLLEHEQHKKELKQTADNWKPWNLKEDFEKMIGEKK
jgi:hypothetical protein